MKLISLSLKRQLLNRCVNSFFSACTLWACCLQNAPYLLENDYHTHADAMGKSINSRRRRRRRLSWMQLLAGNPQQGTRHIQSLTDVSALSFTQLTRIASTFYFIFALQFPSTTKMPPGIFGGCGGFVTAMRLAA